MEPAGEVAERVGDGVRCGVAGERADGTFASLRTTMRERCSFLCDRRLETYSRAEVSWAGSCLASSNDDPASSGEEMRSLAIGMMIDVEYDQVMFGC